MKKLRLLKTYVYYIECCYLTDDGYYDLKKKFRFKVIPSPNKKIFDITGCIEKYLINKCSTLDKGKTIELCSIKEEIIYNEIISENNYEYELGKVIRPFFLCDYDIVEYNKIEIVKLSDFSRDFNMTLKVSFLSEVLNDLTSFKTLDMGNFTYEKLSYYSIKGISCQKIILPKSLSSLELGNVSGYHDYRFDYSINRTYFKEIDFNNNNNLTLLLFRNARFNNSRLTFHNFSNNTKIELGNVYYKEHYPEKMDMEDYVLNDSKCLKNLAFKNNFESTFKKDKEKFIKEKEEKEEKKEDFEEDYTVITHNMDYIQMFNGSNISSVCNPIPYSERLISEAIDEYYQNVVQTDEW